MIKAFLLDLDGVLTESSKAHFKAWKITASKYGIDLDDSFEESLKGISRKESLEAILNHGGLTLEDSIKDAFMAEKNHRYLDIINTYDSSHLFDGVLDLFQLAQTHKIKCALVSASKNADVLITALGIKSYFDYIVDPNRHPSKPAPDMFIDALKYFNISPSEALGFEDSKAGITAIIKAKISPIGIGAFEAIPSFKTLKDSLPYVKSQLKRRHDTY